MSATAPKLRLACGDPACWCRLPRLDEQGFGYVFSTGARYRYVPRPPTPAEARHSTTGERTLMFDVVYEEASA